MELLTKEEREALLKEYELLHKENWERGHITWIVNTILITGSLIVAFQSNIKSFPTYLVSLLLVVITFIMEATSDKITTITYRRIEHIRKILEMTGPTEMYQSQIRGKPWYIIRRNLSYFLYLNLACAYLFLVFQNYCLLLAIFTAGIFILAIRELCDLMKREIEN
jgi:hypothetical protein